MKPSRDFQHTLLMVLVCILPLFLFFALALSGVEIGAIWFFIFLIVCCVAMFFFMGGPSVHNEEEETAVSTDEEDQSSSLLEQVKDVFLPNRRQRVGETLVVEGKLVMESAKAYELLKRRFEPSDVAPLLQEDEAGKPVVVLLPRSMSQRQTSDGKVWLNALLFILTLITTTWAGAAHQGINLWQEPERFSVGLPYTLALMVILGAHELGHYFAARAHGVKVTLPYFIPVPFALGTFGAFIQLKSPSEDRRALFDVGVAGPIAGLVFAIPALLIGLQQSTLITPTLSADAMSSGASVGSSVLFALLAKLSIGSEITESHTLILSPLAFAGWLGLFVTALNFLPIGQLDGGHIAHALFGRKNSHTIGVVALFSLLVLGLFVWSGLLTWAIIVYFIAGTKSAPPLNDVTKLDTGRVTIGALAFVLLFLILVPVPHAFYHSLGIHCPYV